MTSKLIAPVWLENNTRPNMPKEINPFFILTSFPVQFLAFSILDVAWIVNFLSYQAQPKLTVRGLVVSVAMLWSHKLITLT